MPATVSFWDRTKALSSTAYEKALKPGFEKAYSTVNKLEPHVNRLSHKVGSETFWPGELDKESEKAARILRSFCKDGVYDQIDEEVAKKAEDESATVDNSVPNGKQRVLKKIPASVIRNAKGLCIFTCMRYGWVIGGSGGAGVLVGRHPETGQWGPPSGIHMQNVSFGFLIGVDLLDTVLVINTYDALEAFTKIRCTLGTEVGVAAGPLGMGGLLETSIHKKPAPVWSYVKSRGLYGGVAIDGNIVIERTDENARFYDEPEIRVAKILRGEVRRPPTEKYKILIDTISAAEGQNVDENLLPDGIAPSDMELLPEGPLFGIPDEDDPDPFGVRALEAQGLTIREAGTHRRATPDSFEFRPSPTSPVFNTFRKSVDSSLKRKEWRSSIISTASTDRATQTAGDDASRRDSISPSRSVVVLSTPPPLPPRGKVDSPLQQSITSETSSDELRDTTRSNSPDLRPTTNGGNSSKRSSELVTESVGLGIRTDTSASLDGKIEGSGEKSLDDKGHDDKSHDDKSLDDKSHDDKSETTLVETDQTQNPFEPSQTNDSKEGKDLGIKSSTDSVLPDTKNKMVVTTSTAPLSIVEIKPINGIKIVQAQNEVTENADDEDDSGDDDSSDDDFSDFESDVEISTAVPVTARPKAGVVNIPQRITPALPPRNPGRLSRSPMSERSTGADAFEHADVSAQDSDNSSVDRRRPSDTLRVNGYHRNLDTAATLSAKSDAMPDEEFHSIPPSPINELGQNDSLSSKVADTSK